MLIHVYYRVQGAHIHARVFVGRTEGQLAHAGTLTMRPDEFLALARGQFKAEFFEEQKQ
ncbi:MAG TPA: hypothetical protein VJN66_08635 [Rhodanobacteraceae bacterium]|nr:hypothetical protein [Rhodanobacteraceae bacterium]